MNKLLLSLVLVIVFVGSARGLMCYLCADCPTPFYPDTRYVGKQLATYGYCAKKSRSSAHGAKAGRGAAEYGLCTSSGCGWKRDGSGEQFYTCCCRGNDYCNTGSTTSKSTLAVLFGAISLLTVNRYV